MEGDSIRWTYVRDAAAAFFVAAHTGTVLDITVEKVAEDSLESGEVFTTYALTEASLKGFRSDLWWSNVVEELGYERAYKVFSALADSVEMNQEERPDCGKQGWWGPPGTGR